MRADAADTLWVYTRWEEEVGKAPPREAMQEIAGIFFVLNPSFPCCGFCIFPWGRAGDANTQLVGPRELHPTLGHLQEVGFALK